MKRSFAANATEYGADADKALSWYDKHRSVRATAEVHAFYEPESGSLQYVVADRGARAVRLSTRCWILTADRARSRINRPRIS